MIKQNGTTHLSWVRQFIFVSVYLLWFVFGVIALKFHYEILSAYCNSGGLRELYTSAPLRGSACSVVRLGSVFRVVTGYFRPITVISESMCAHWLRHVMQLQAYLAVENKWHILRSHICQQYQLTTVSAGNTVSWLESSWDGPVYFVATFPATAPSHREIFGAIRLKNDSDKRLSFSFLVDRNTWIVSLSSEFHELYEAVVICEISCSCFIPSALKCGRPFLSTWTLFGFSQAVRRTSKLLPGEMSIKKLSLSESCYKQKVNVYSR